MTEASSQGEPRFLLALEYDLSLNTGYSINERESAVALLDRFSDRLRVVSPEPSVPGRFRDPRIHYVRDHRRHHPLHYPPFVGAMKRKIRQLHEEEPFSAIIFRPGPLPLLPLWALREGWPVVLKKLSGYSLFEKAGRGWKRSALAAAAGPLYHELTRRCLAADVESHAYAAWIPTRFPIDGGRLRFVPNGANTNVFRPEARSECRRRFGWERFRHLVGYAGALDSLRCVDVAVEAAVRLSGEVGLGFVFAGGGPLLEPMKDKVRSAGLEDRILFPGFLPYGDMPQVLSSFDVGLDLSRVPLMVHGSPVYGSFSQKIAQYLACGVPVVSWDTLDTRFLEEEGVGRTVPLGDEEGLERAILDLLPGEEDGDHSIRARAREVAEVQLSAESIARTRMDWWTGLVRGNSTASAMPAG
jgi:glycosyltransferase involved in cell wall biosynthesis